MENLSVTLRTLARRQGLCDEWFNEWKDDDDIDTLLERYIRGFDFAVNNDYPPLDMCRRVFDKNDLHRHHIYLDEKVDIDAEESGYYVFLGNCPLSVLRVSGYKVVTVYVRHNSNVIVKVSDGAMAFIHRYDQSDAIIHKDSFSKGFIYNK